jgi:type VI protein secretion system component VasK
MFYAILTLSMITACCVIGLVVERWQARRVDKRTDLLIATLRAANEARDALEQGVNERVNAFREARNER